MVTARTASSTQILEQKFLTDAEMTALTGSPVTVSFVYRSSSISVVAAGITLHDELPVDHVDPLVIVTWRMFIGGKTGSSHNEHRVDNVVVTYEGYPAPPPPSSPPRSPPISPPFPPALETVALCDFSSTCSERALFGDASITSGSLQLTANTQNQNGRIKFNNGQPETHKLRRVTVEMNMYTTSTSGADGLGIIFGESLSTHDGARGWDNSGGLGGPGVHWSFRTTWQNPYPGRSEIHQRSSGATQTFETRHLTSAEEEALTGQ
jgi:hypothetical protein